MHNGFLFKKQRRRSLFKLQLSCQNFSKKKLKGDAHNHYLSDGVRKSTQEWNEQRKLILQDAFSDLLFPLMEKEARSLLTIRAKGWLLQVYGYCLWKKVCSAPYQGKEGDANTEDDSAPRVMACCWGQESGNHFCDVGFIRRSLGCAVCWVPHK